MAMPVLVEGWFDAVDAVDAELDVVPAPDPSTMELDSPSGEQPTKAGAVSPTEAHSCSLNKIASVTPSTWFHT